MPTIYAIIVTVYRTASVASSKDEDDAIVVFVLAVSISNIEVLLSSAKVM